jgi:hypothetical protein
VKFITVERRGVSSPGTFFSREDLRPTIIEHLIR